MNRTYANHKAYEVLYLCRCEVALSLTSFSSICTPNWEKQWDIEYCQLL